MKILQVITTLRIGGAEKLIVDMVPKYQEAGHQVDVLLFDGVETHFTKELIAKGVRVFSLGINRSVYSPDFIFKLIPIIKKYDIVHTHNSVCQFYVALASMFLKKSPKLVTTEHNTNNRRRSIPFFKWIDKFMYKRYASIIAISNQASINLKQQIGNIPSIQTIFNGVDLSKYRQASPLLRDEFGAKADDFIMVMVAGFREQKDQDTLIKSLSYLPDHFKLWLVGDGERKAGMESFVKEKNLQNRVLFCGIRADVPQILKTADVVVMSSHWEGLSLSSIEGMCVGKPFVASDVDGLHEIVDGYGILFPHQDEKALAQIMQTLEKDAVYKQNVAEQCGIRADQFDITKTVDQYLKVYNRLVR